MNILAPYSGNDIINRGLYVALLEGRFATIRASGSTNACPCLDAFSFQRVFLCGEESQSTADDECHQLSVTGNMEVEFAPLHFISCVQARTHARTIAPEETGAEDQLCTCDFVVIKEATSHGSSNVFMGEGGRREEGSWSSSSC
eukprot:scaffold4510_cov183-Amphora_coffeaeformis.AAC.102